MRDWPKSRAVAPTRCGEGNRLRSFPRNVATGPCSRSQLPAFSTGHDAADAATRRFGRPDSFFAYFGTCRRSRTAVAGGPAASPVGGKDRGDRDSSLLVACKRSRSFQRWGDGRAHAYLSSQLLRLHQRGSRGGSQHNRVSGTATLRFSGTSSEQSFEARTRLPVACRILVMSVTPGQTGAILASGAPGPACSVRPVKGMICASHPRPLLKSVEVSSTKWSASAATRLGNGFLVLRGRVQAGYGRSGPRRSRGAHPQQMRPTEQQGGQADG